MAKLTKWEEAGIPEDIVKDTAVKFASLWQFVVLGRTMTRDEFLMKDEQWRKGWMEVATLSLVTAAMSAKLELQRFKEGR